MYCLNIPGRLRVNMGNIYVEQKKYPQAIKMYRMALDQIQDTHKGVRQDARLLVTYSTVGYFCGVLTFCGSTENCEILFLQMFILVYTRACHFQALLQIYRVFS